MLPRMILRLSVIVRLTVVLVALFVLGSCNLILPGGNNVGDGGGVIPNSMGAKLGEVCSAARLCRNGLLCASGRCEFGRSGMPGTICSASGDCIEGFYCTAMTRTCERAGTVPMGGTCRNTADCVGGLACAIVGFNATCISGGTGDLDSVCSGSTDCLAGLSCLQVPGRSGTVCASAPPGFPDIPSIPFWGGPTCNADNGPKRAYFEIPRGTNDQDFYRLPYPNDIRQTATGLNLAGMPSPGTAVPFDIMGMYRQAAEVDQRAFSLNPVAFFRFSAPYANVDGAISFVNVTESAPDYKASLGSWSWFTTSGPVSKYICNDWLAIRGAHGAPLRPSTTYAVILTTDVRPAGGGSFERSADLDAMLAASAPADATLAAAYAKYAPLRNYLRDSGRNPSTILNAAVFTTQDPHARTRALRRAIRARTAPTVSDVTVCAPGVMSPCHDGTDDHSCSAVDDSFTEVHGRIALPIFQHGTAPYFDAMAAGGDGGFRLAADGTPEVARTENVCFALTVPKGAAAPSSGWPLLIHLHGTGGSFTGAVRGGIARDMASATTRVATLTIDLPQHGSRKNGSTRSSDILFYNFGNPRAARDNVAQGTADLFSLVHFAANGQEVAVSGLPAVDFDPTLIGVFAHSQGATHASLAVPFETQVRGVLLSGNGGDLIMSLLNKTNPVNIKAAVPFALLDADGNGNLAAGNFHPALAFFQQFFDTVDPVVYAPLLGATGTDLANPHVFQTYGLGDTYSPEPTMRAFAQAAGYPSVRPELADLGIAEVDAPLTANVTIGSAMRTQGIRQYRPTDGDGHFVSTNNVEGRADVNRFFASVFAGSVPSIGR